MKVVLYHTNCQDGLFSAYNMWKVLGSSNVLYIPVNYKPIQDMPPLEALEYIFKSYVETPRTMTGWKHSFKDDKNFTDEYKNIDLYLVDYSFPVKHLLEYIPLFKSILILDHHETAVNSYLNEFKDFKEDKRGWKTIKPSDNCKIVFSEKESGAKLTFMYYNENVRVPIFIELVSDRDLWTFNLKDTRAFKYGCEMYQLTSFPIIDDLMETSLNEIIAVGRKYELLYDFRLEKIYKNNLSSISVEINNVQYKCAFINTYLDVASDICDYAITEEGYDIAIAYNIDKRLSVSCSLRSKEGLDTSMIALMFGGGGHKRASGFHLTIQQFAELTTSKEIKVNL